MFNDGFCAYVDGDFEASLAYFYMVAAWGCWWYVAAIPFD